MAALISTDIKDIFTIKVKPRQDDYTDQYSRIFMVKLLIVSSLVMGVDWFQDSVTCMVLDVDLTKVSSDFVHSACWIQGFYIYPELIGSVESSNYYGIPQNIQHDGREADGSTCKVEKGVPKCRAMERLYYHQYQWMPFFVASIAIFYYIPYIIFQIVNTDVQSLKETVAKEKIDPSDIVQNFFNYDINSLFQMRFSVLMILTVKCIYLGVNLGAFYMTDVLLNGDFQTYGNDWMEFTPIPSYQSREFKAGAHPKPGNILLPTFGFCEINEGSASEIYVYKNKSKFICEISLNVMYQYIFLVLWFIMLSGIFISACGIILNIAGHTVTVVYFIRASPSAKALFQILSFRECEYLSIIRRSDAQLYSDVLEKLWIIRPELQKFTPPGNRNHHSVNMTNLNGTMHKESNLDPKTKSFFSVL